MKRLACLLLSLLILMSVITAYALSYDELLQKAAHDAHAVDGSHDGQGPEQRSVIGSAFAYQRQDVLVDQILQEQ